MKRFAALALVAACGGAAAVHAPPNAALVPDGKEWFCVRTARGSHCMRREADCVAESNRSAGSACTHPRAAWCVTMKRVQGGAGGALCFEQYDECERERDVMTGDLDGYYADVSDCGAWR